MRLKFTVKDCNSFKVISIIVNYGIAGSTFNENSYHSFSLRVSGPIELAKKRNKFKCSFSEKNFCLLSIDLRSFSSISRYSILLSLSVFFLFPTKSLECLERL